MVSRTLVLVAVLACFAGIAYSYEGCATCNTGIGCATNLSRCVVGNFSHSYDGSQNNLACNAGAGEIWFACLSSNQNGIYDCFYSGNCSAPFDQCQCRSDIKCYTSDANCKDGIGAVTPESGLNTDCLALGRPVYACWEVPQICRNSATCKIIPRGGGNQDPHFKGFDGSEYYFEGKAGQDYNIISDTNFQLNAHFIRLNRLKGTYMGRLGVLFGSQSIMFDALFGVFYNDTLMTEGEVETADGTFSVETIDRRLRLNVNNGVYQIVATVVFEKDERETAYINIQASLIAVPSRPHGILGQTARIAIPGADPLPKPFKVEGAEADYHVRDGILGHDFTFNMFNEEAQPITVGGSRFVRNAAPLFEAVVDAGSF